jgi:hypothetical protein
MALSALIVYLNIDSGPAYDTTWSMWQQTKVASWGWNDDFHVTTHAVHGRYTLLEGWCTLLEDSGLTFHIDEKRRRVHVWRETVPGERDELCQDKPNGFGPGFIHPPQADWK